MTTQERGVLLISVGVILGSESDEKFVHANYLNRLKELKLGYDLSVCSADRNLEDLPDVVLDCLNMGAELFVCYAGLSPALPRLAAGIAPYVPVIGVCEDEDHGDQRAITNTPPGRPVIYVGAGKTGLKKAVDLTVLLLGWRHPDTNALERQKDYVAAQAAEKPPQPHKEKYDPEEAAA
jgi:phosphoribosylcarboxyaminoimidazole (NCAIR) mutase